MIYRIHPENPQSRKLEQVAEILDRGGLVIYPTDTVYAIGCSLEKRRSIERLAKIKGEKMGRIDFSIICPSLSHLSEYTKNVDRHVYKVLNKNLPGPFTFILRASNKIPKLFDTNRKTVGIRIPDNKITLELAERLGHPIVTTSLHAEDDILDYLTDPLAIAEKWENRVDAIVDGGYGNNKPSTIVNCADHEIEIIREGIGTLET